MHPTEAMAALAANPQLGILLDRRHLAPGRAIPIDLLIMAELELDPDARRAGVRAALVAAAGGGDLPERCPGSLHGQMRLMDRFFLPQIRDEAVIATMFDLIAGMYDSLTDWSLNVATASLLLQAALADTGPAPMILDFGCGTGVAMDALAALPNSARLLGVDASAGMLAQASERGLVTMPLSAWRLRPPLVDGAISNFVLHYGVSTADLGILASSLRPGARFVANLFGAEAELLAGVVDILQRKGLELEAMTDIAGTKRPNLLLKFRRQP